MKIYHKYKNYINFGFFSVVYNFCLIITNFLSIKWVLPSDLGLWNSVFLFSNYIAILQLGIFNTISRDVPYYFGKNNIIKVEQLVSAAYWHTRILFLFSIFIMLLSTIYLVFFYKNTKIIITVIFVGLVTAFSFYQNLLIVTYRTASQFHKLAKVYRWQTVIVILSVALVYYWSYFGFVVRNLLLVLLLSFSAYINRPFKFKAKFIKDIYLELIKTGILFYIVIYAINITSTFARLFLLKHQGFNEVGLFFPAFGVIMGMELITSSIGQVTYPKLSYEVGKNQGNSKLFTLLFKATILSFLILSAISMVIYLVFPYVITSYFPLYSDSIMAIKYAAIAGVFNSSIVYSIFLSKKKWSILYPTAIIKVLLFGFLINYFIQKMENPITGAAFGWMISNIIYYLVILAIAYIDLKRNYEPKV